MTEASITSIQIVNTGFATGPVQIRVCYLMQRLSGGGVVPMPIPMTQPAGLAALAQAPAPTEEGS